MKNLTVTSDHILDINAVYSDKDERQLKSLEQILSQNNISIPSKSISNSNQTISKIELVVYKELIIMGEPFQIIESENIISLVHKNWSLQGSGVSLLKAESDLLYNATELFEVYSNIEESDLTKEAKNLKHYLEKIYYYGSKKTFRDQKSTKQ